VGVDNPRIHDSYNELWRSVCDLRQILSLYFVKWILGLWLQSLRVLLRSGHNQ